MYCNQVIKADTEEVTGDLFLEKLADIDSACRIYPDAEDRHARADGLGEICLHNGISILCKFGHLRI